MSSEVSSSGTPIPAGVPVTITQGAYGPTALTTVYAGDTYVKTLTYNVGGQLTNVSIWVKQ